MGRSMNIDLVIFLKTASQLVQALQEFREIFPDASDVEICQLARQLSPLRSVTKMDTAQDTSHRATAAGVWEVVRTHFKSSNFRARDVAEIIGVETQSLSSSLYSLRRIGRIDRVGRGDDRVMLWKVKKT